MQVEKCRVGGEGTALRSSADRSSQLLLALNRHSFIRAWFYQYRTVRHVFHGTKQRNASHFSTTKISRDFRRIILYCKNCFIDFFKIIILLKTASYNPGIYFSDRITPGGLKLPTRAQLLMKTFKCSEIRQNPTQKLFRINILNSQSISLQIPIHEMHVGKLLNRVIMHDA